jgi:anti-sigma regulatory factor (Ser/Thr protein kinase)
MGLFFGGEGVVDTLVLANRLGELTRLTQWLRDWTVAEGLEPEVAQALDLALEEVVVNVMNHAYGPGVDLPIIVRLGLEGDRLAIQVEDQGPAYDPLAAPAPPAETPLLERTPGGLGIFLVRTIMDEMSWERRDGVNLLNMIKRLRGRSAEGM